MSEPMTTKPIGVAVLGLGNVGSEVVRIIEESAERPDRPHRRPAGAARHRRAPRRPTTAACRSSCSPTTSKSWSSRDDVDIVVEVIGGDRACPQG